MKFRDLKANEIDCRVQSVKENGLVLLLYKDARVDMNILDETVGAECWQREHYECKGNLFCKVGICCKKQHEQHTYHEWIWKSDCGVESNTEAQKGEASDSFKRACFNWGIGRELYTSPLIWIPAEKCNIKQNSKGGYACYDSFEVSNILIENKEIVGLEIKNTKTRAVVYEFGTKKPKGEPKPQAQLTPREKLIAKLKEKGIDIGRYAEANGLTQNTTNEKFNELLKELED